MSEPVEVPHIDFDKPTGDPLVEVRRGYDPWPDLAKAFRDATRALEAFTRAWRQGQ